MNDTAWDSARKRAAQQWEKETGRGRFGASGLWGFAHLRGHDEHTYGRRLRAAKMAEEDRKSLLGHMSHMNGSVTSDDSAAELAQMLEKHANLISATDSRGPRY